MPVIVVPGFDPLKNVRTTDPATSLVAAQSIDPTEAQLRVLRIHKAHAAGLTDEELLTLYRQEFPEVPESTPRKRRHDLVDAGLIEDSGVRRRVGGGKRVLMGIVWRAT